LRILLSLFAVLALPPLAFVAVWYLQGPDAPLLAFAAELFGFLRDEVPQLDVYRERLTAEGRADLLPLVTAVFSYDFFLLLFLPVPLALAHLVSPALRRARDQLRDKVISKSGYKNLRYCLVIGIWITLLCVGYLFHYGNSDRLFFFLNILSSIKLSSIFVTIDSIIVLPLIMLLSHLIYFVLSGRILRDDFDE